VLVAHTCNPTYSGGRDQEDCGSKPAQANRSQDPILKKTPHKKDDEVAYVVEHLPSKYESLILCTK
jgi:hypothetical protein